MKSSTHDKAEGTAKIIAGKVKEGTGDVLRSPRLAAAGKAEQLEGRTQKKVGDAEKALENQINPLS